jgi:exopolysaccharide biosynthesis protein
MELQTNDTVYVSRLERKPKRSRFWRGFWIICLTFLLCGGGFLYGTNQGHQLRRMAVGMVLTSQHAQYVKYMGFLLSKSEVAALREAWLNPPTKQSAIAEAKPKQQKGVAEAAALEQPKETIKVETLNTGNYTAKILVIPDPTTVHVVGSKYTHKGQPLSELLAENHAIAGINGGGFVDPAGNGSGGQPLGIVISNGKVINVPNGDNNVTQLVGAFLKDGQFITGNYSVNQLLKLGTTEAISFGPQLIVNGKNLVTSAQDGAWGWAPRTAIGQAQDGSVIMIITDGRFYWDKTHRGASMSDMAHMFESYKVKNAIAMDGGGSTTMMKDGDLLLKPATDTRVGMRYLPNAWVVIPN